MKIKDRKQAFSKIATQRRIHIGLGVADLDAAEEFFTALFGESPSKRRADYAKFTPENPSVNLSLSQKELPQTAGERPRGNHFGIEVQSSVEIDQAEQRLSAAGIATRREDGEACCYAVQDKLWVTAPNGDAWEIFHVLEDSEFRHDPGHTCCAGEGEGKPEGETVSACC